MLYEQLIRHPSANTYMQHIHASYKYLAYIRRCVSYETCTTLQSCTPSCITPDDFSYINQRTAVCDGPTHGLTRKPACSTTLPMRWWVVWHHHHQEAPSPERTILTTVNRGGGCWLPRRSYWFTLLGTSNDTQWVVGRIGRGSVGGPLARRSRCPKTLWRFPHAAVP